MRIVVALSVFCVTLASAAARQEVSGTVPDFSETRLREGKEAYAAGRSAEAVSQFRIAAFGFLDRPTMLCESLVYVALAEAAAEHRAQAQAAVERLSDVERRFPGCAGAKLDPAARADFESRFHKKVPGSAPPTAAPKSPTLRPPSAPTPRPGG